MKKNKNIGIVQVVPRQQGVQNNDTKNQVSMLCPIRVCNV